MADVNKLVFSILSFLDDQKKHGNLSDDQVESIEVAYQCLESAYKINVHDPDMQAKYQVQRNLLDIFNSQMPSTDFASLSLHEASLEEKQEAEDWKNKGNDFMKNNKFSDALECYAKAINLDGKTAVYYCNRAAAYSKLNKPQLAIDDCNLALTIDPSYSKAYGRLGIAYTAINDHESARECYRKALELDPDNQSYQNNLEIAEQKAREFAFGAGFAGGPAGGFDMGGLLSNPAMMNMASTMMANPEMQRMMANILSGTTQGQGEGVPSEQGLTSLLQAGQQLASQMQQQNPDLVAQIRSQFQGQPTGQEPQEPPKDSESNQ
ncbi:small glutamine-rich tetratricopeptide repeat-containing protein alpha-like [Gigantopelta aegis]|uniref:small glutamine-rich tetratricopeptide repeat-containing protein alpha-like n=1 Tax=Gigantopelta aegis TaxID=1735272 RepID=UPI001B8876E2|nr:small glutamine-rich tetratricopeptide repeat-containing protein alpha-like [Gigantopelta aegis]